MKYYDIRHSWRKYVERSELKKLDRQARMKRVLAYLNKETFATKLLRWLGYTPGDKEQ